MKHEVQSEPTTEPLAHIDFENADERERRIWTTSGGDAAFAILTFLKGSRKRDIQLSEIINTRLYRKANSAERRALQFVCAQVPKFEPQEFERKELEKRDGALMSFVAGEHVSKSLRQSIEGIPLVLKTREQFDKMNFRKQYRRPDLFGWIFTGDSRGQTL